MTRWMVGCGALVSLMVGCSARDASADGDDGADEATSGTNGDGSASGSSGGSTGDGGPTDGGSDTGIPPSASALDVLFVVDNSGSMGEEQAALAGSIFAFVETLEAADLDLRIAVTTTDNGNPWCNATSPEGGTLVLSSCVDRAGDFVSQTGELNVYDVACLSQCELGNAQLPISPTTTLDDPEVRPRPWLQSGPSGKNFPETVSMREALACMLPMGINGCGFEQPLESMNKSVLRSQAPEDAAFGFLRDDASLLVVVMTDEVDCSHNPDLDLIFLPDGTKVFWEDPAAQFPTSALCWNAGTRCEPNPEGGYECSAASYTYDGESLEEGSQDAIDNAVLHPVARYEERLAQLRAQKQSWNPDLDVVVALIAGVSVDGVPIYFDGTPEFELDFGIGPGCVAVFAGEEQTAVPPVRLWSMAREFGDGEAHSICQVDLSASLASIAASMLP